MCYGCWEMAGKPAIANPQVIAVAKIVSAVTERYGYGGLLHQVIDNFKVTDEDLEFHAEMLMQAAARWVSPKGEDLAVRDEGLRAQERCLHALSRIHEEERMSAIALAAGYFTAHVRQGDPRTARSS